MDLTNLFLNAQQRTDMSVCELARHIFCIFRDVEKEKKYDIDRPFQWMSQEGCPDRFLHLGNDQHLLDQFLKDEKDSLFSMKFYEAMALLKRRRLLMRHIWGTCLTSVGMESDFHDGILILVDDARKIIDSLKEEIADLDPVAEQYYLESLRACQEGLYISSVICLGAASERVIDCLKKAIIRRFPQHERLGRKWISDSIRYILTNFKEIFGSVIDPQLGVDLKEQLDLMEKIYRLNRSEAGHPRSVPMNIARCEQENYLNSFRRYAITIFAVIEKLDWAP